MKSLQPLREAIPCQLIMADTGSDDGSRGIAEKYADDVFDFPWTDDFSAARNAVMDRCTGKWYLTLDCDEWLEDDVSELSAWVNDSHGASFGYVIQRNYSTQELEKGTEYSDFYALRLCLLKPEVRYSGVIHESFAGAGGMALRLKKTILHHDGYLYASPDALKKKTKRNMSLLRKELEKNPNDLGRLLQCIESGGLDPDFPQYIRRGMKELQSKNPSAKLLGGAVQRHAVRAAFDRDMPELEQWMAYAETHFQDSILSKIDLQYTMFYIAHEKENWAQAVRHGTRYLQNLRDYREGKLDETGMQTSVLGCGTPAFAHKVEIGLCNAYTHLKQYEDALNMLAGMDTDTLDPGQIRNYMLLLMQLHDRTTVDTTPVIIQFYEDMQKDIGNEKKKELRQAFFRSMCQMAFTQEYRKQEEKAENYWRPAYTLFLPLEDKCEEGRAATLMTTDDPLLIRHELMQVEDWSVLPAEALAHAIQSGETFPLAEKPLSVEVQDGLAARLTGGDNLTRKLALTLPIAQDADSQSLSWLRALMFAALRTYNWKMNEKDGAQKEDGQEKNDTAEKAFAITIDDKARKENRIPGLSGASDQEKEKEKAREESTPEEGMALIRRFTQLEAILLPRMYTPDMFTEENALLLPPMHRWGFYCTLAFEALDGGDPRSYLRLLHEGLKVCTSEKDMVRFLLDRFLDDARPKTSPELLMLADKVRETLAAYAPDDPAVLAIKESPAYQQVAWLIEPEPVGQMIQ